MPGLDGLRGLAALYVVLFHCGLLTFPVFPGNVGPPWLSALMYGRLAVVVFLALSGFSLGISPARYGWDAGGVVRFLRRRAWRILPPYWAALVLSVLVARLVVPASLVGPPTKRSVVVYGLLLQDLFTAPTPNGAFWSIAVEAELYLLFPLLLLIRRRWGAVVAVTAVTVPVVVRGLLAPDALPVEGLNLLTPHLAPVFVVGVVAAGVTVARERIRRLPWHWFAAVAAAPILLLIVVNGPMWTVLRYFWLDLAVVPAIAMLLAAIATGRPRLLVRLLATRPMRGLGGFSYSLYLIHLPIVMVVARKVAPRFVPVGLPAFWVTLAISLPASVLAAALFATVFETPFRRHRSWRSLSEAVAARRRPFRSPDRPARRHGELPDAAVVDARSGVAGERGEERRHPGAGTDEFAAA